MTLRGTFRDGVIIPEQSVGLRNGDEVEIVRRDRAKGSRTKPPAKKRGAAQKRLDDFMSAFGSLRDKPEWKGKTSAAIAREIRARAPRRAQRG